ncbi:MAG: hypothetical protein HXS40_05970 [Theionarchaea archaeon]|nr:hypothetical protein [Theionarchaea archaeon]
MQLVRWITEFVADMIHKWKLKKRPSVSPKAVDRSWVAKERKRINDALKNKWN